MSQTESVPELTADEAIYETDEDGDLVPHTYQIETSVGTRTVKILPIPKGRAMEYEQRFSGRDDVDIEDLDDVLNEQVIGDIDWSDPNIKPGVYVPILNKVMELITGEVPSNEFHAEVRQEIEERQSEGN